MKHEWVPLGGGESGFKCSCCNGKRDVLRCDRCGTFSCGVCRDDGDASTRCEREFLGVAFVSCPWCDRVEGLRIERDASRRGGRWRVECAPCGVIGPCTSEERSTCEAEWLDALALWNARAVRS